MTEEQPILVYPGFYKLNLNLMHIEDQHEIKKRKKSLDKAKVQENEVVHKAVHLMENLLDSSFLRRSFWTNNIQKLKNTLKTNPNHLNTLKDLAEMHRKMHLDMEAKMYDDSIQRVLTSNNFDKEIADCLLEQGYAYLFEEYGNNEQKAWLNLNEASKQLMIETSNASGERKQHLQNATQFTFNAQRLVTATCIQPMNQYLLNKRQRSVEYFKDGIKRLKRLTVAKSEISVWKFYHAVACNRLYNSLRQSTDKSTNTICTLTNLTNESYCLFLEVIIELPTDSIKYAFYRSRSYAYIAYSLITRKNIPLTSLNIENGKREFDAMQNDPEYGFLKAIDMNPNDEVILHRYGEALFMRCNSKQDTHNKLCTLERAEKLLTDAIILNPSTHLVAYGTRTNVYIAMFDLNEKSENQKKGEPLLVKAREDGRLLMKENFKTLDYCALALVCQYLGKFPNCKSLGKEYVVDVAFTNEALCHLNTALRVNGLTYTLSYKIASVLFDLGEYETATEWAKRAFLLSNTQNPLNITHICQYILQGKSDFGDMFNVLTYGVRKYENKEVIREVFTSKFIKQNFIKLFDFITYLQTIPLNKHQARLAEELTKRIGEEKSTIALLDRRIRKFTYDRTKCVPLKYTQADIDMVINGREQCTNQNGDGYQVPTLLEYDYSAITGKDDVGWITCFILNQLSLQLFGDDTALKGRTLGVDRDSYSSIILDTINAVCTSRRTLMFLSVSFLKREWPLLKKTILDHLQKRPEYLILLVLGNCEIPTELKQLSCIDIANDKQIPFEIDNLKMNIVSSQFM